MVRGAILEAAQVVLPVGRNRKINFNSVLHFAYSNSPLLEGIHGYLKWSMQCRLTAPEEEGGCCVTWGAMSRG